MLGTKVEFTLQLSDTGDLTKQLFTPGFYNNDQFVPCDVGKHSAAALVDKKKERKMLFSVSRR